MTFHSIMFAIFFSLASLFLCSNAHFSELSTSDFSVALIHREHSPLSPFYDPSATHFKRLKNVIHRSNLRVSHIQSKCTTPSDGFQSNIRYDEGEYLMKLNVGTPPVEVLVIADTGSDLTWIQCQPCKRCFKHKYPLFNPHSSSSYKTLKCYSKECKGFQGKIDTCTKQHNKCQYSVAYGDGSYTEGHLATEKFTFGKSSIDKVAFGCGHNNNGIFSSSSSGIIGLGAGPLSLITQLNKTIQGQFSYCLVSIFTNETSTIKFGKKPQTSDSRIVSTPLYVYPGESYYYLYLEKVIIGNKSFELKREDDNGPYDQQGSSILIDSGTTLTYLPKGNFYDGIVSTLKEYIGLETIDDPEGLFKLCYKTSSNIKVPEIIFEFKGAAALKLQPSTTFVEVVNGITCFTIVPSDINIFGNILQENYLVSYDLQKKTVSFQATDCSRE